MIVFDLFFHKIRWHPNFFLKNFESLFLEKYRHLYKALLPQSLLFVGFSYRVKYLHNLQSRPVYRLFPKKRRKPYLSYLWLDLNKTKTGINHFKNRSEDSQLCFSNSLVYFLIPILKEIIFLNPRMCLMLECI
jgi:hypothetical protein